MMKDNGWSVAAGGDALLQPPATVLEIAHTLLRAGHESWFVGGAVRDALLGHANLDWDIATAATPPQVQKLFRRTVPVGVDFGTVGVLDKEGVMHEVTTFRRDVHTDGRHAVVEFGVSFDEDLARRDFTINAIAYGPDSRQLHDPFHGQKDLRDGLVRAVGVAADRMREDRLRALRAMRFAARFGFAIETETWAAIRESAPHLGRLSMERVQQEIEKTMAQVDRPGDAFRLWRDGGAFAVLAPELASISDIARATLDRLPRARDGSAEQQQHTVNRLTALVLDVQPAAARDLLRALRFSNERVRWIGDIVERWHVLHASISEALHDESVSEETVRRWVSAIGRTRVHALFAVLDARFAAEDRDARPNRREGVRALREHAEQIALRDPLETGDLAIDGGDLMKAGIKAGPQLGATLRGLLDWVLEDPARNTNDQLLARVRELAGVSPHS